MGRAPRRIGADLTYHVTIRGNRRAPIFMDDQDRRKFLSLLDDVGRSHGWEGWAWCLMSNHVHLCLTTPQPNLSSGMRDIFGQYARFFNWKNTLDAHLFGSRFHSVDVTSDEHLTTVIRYVAQNPVRAGLVDSALAWEWSSLHSVLKPSLRDGFIKPDRVLALFHDRPVHAVALLRQLIALPSPSDEELIPQSTPNTRAVAQALPARRAAAVLLDRGLTIATVARSTGVSRGAIRAWQQNGFAADQRRR